MDRWSIDRLKRCCQEQAITGRNMELDCNQDGGYTVDMHDWLSPALNLMHEGISHSAFRSHRNVVLWSLTQRFTSTTTNVSLACLYSHVRL